MPSTSEPLPVERFAALNAEIDAGQPVRDVLEREDISEEAWATTQEHWLSRMAEESERHRFEVTNRYGTVFKAHRAVASAKLKLIALAPDTEVRPETTRDPDSAPARSTPASTPPSTPPPKPSAPPQAPPQPPPASMGVVPAPLMGPPSVVLPPSTQPAPSTQPTPPTFAKPDMPFAHAPAEAQPADVPLPTPRMVQPLEPDDADDDGSTMVTPSMQSADPGSRLPFQARRFNPAATIVANIKPTGDALPFSPDTDRMPPETKASGSRPPPPPEPESKYSGTLFAVSPFIGDPLPFGKNRKAHPATVALPPVAPTAHQVKTAAFPIPGMLSEKPHFSLEHFASMSAEIAHHPERVDDVRRRYGLTREQHRDEAARWRALFDASPRQAERFTALVDQYRAYLHSRDGGS